MQEYLQNIDTAIAFEDVLKECSDELSTVEILVQKGLLESSDAVENLGIQLPWERSSQQSKTLSKDVSTHVVTSDKLEDVAVGEKMGPE